MDSEALRSRRRERLAVLRRRRRRASALIALLAVLLAVLLTVGSSSNKAPSRQAARSDGGPAGSAASRPAGSAASETAGGPPGREPVPILMYHVIAPAPPGAPYPGLYVEPQEFAEQMQALKRAGWHAVTLDQVQAYWKRGVPLGAGKPIVLSFDNGYNSQYTQALPVLRRLGWVGVENIQLTGLPPSQGGLGAGEVRGLLAAGWELDTQGFSHADLIRLGSEQLHHEVAASRQELRRRYHVAVNWFCYPSGHYDTRVLAEVKAAGYVGSTTVVPGWAHPQEDRYRLHRLRILGGTTPAALLELLSSTREDPAAPISYGEA